MNFYEIGKNYLISCIKLDYNLLFLNNNLLDFLRGYIELNSVLIKPDFNNFKATDETIFNIYFTDNDLKILEYIKDNFNICCDIIKSNFYCNPNPEPYTSSPCSTTELHSTQVGVGYMKFGNMGENLAL